MIWHVIQENNPSIQSLSYSISKRTLNKFILQEQIGDDRMLRESKMQECNGL